jgi:murein DD-endopeptidase MepM/ murein hydrolase activator NlpD
MAFAEPFRLLRVVITVALAISLADPGDGAQNKKRPAQKKAATAVPAWTKIDCGDNVELRVSGSSGPQGGLLQTEMRSATPLTDVTGTWDEKPVPFWQDTAPAKQMPAASKKSSTAVPPTDLQRALIGIDLEKAAGSYEFAVSAKKDGAPISCKAQIAVRAGKFATEHLKVAPNFVEPNPEQLARAQEEGKRLREIYATITPEKLWQGKFRIPLDGVTTGGNFGKRRVLNGTPSSPHTGVDMPALTGTPVHASQRGLVVLAEELYYAGNTVLIDHGLGIYTLYGHFSEIDAKPGDLVEAGTVIGKVGATGRVTGPHLHWGLIVDRSRVNALSIVAISGR